MSQDYQSGNRVIRIIEENSTGIQAKILYEADPSLIGLEIQLTPTELGSCYAPYTGQLSLVDPALSSLAANRFSIGGK